MDVLLLGTGAAAGWPNPFCSCRSCAWALEHGQVRGQTAALVDGRLLLDCGPEAPRAAARAGVSLGSVRHLLVTHGHFDHAGPMALSWAGRTEPIDLVGPARALAVFGDWTCPGDPVRPVPVLTGDELDLDGYRVRVLAAAHGDDVVGPGVLYDVTGPDAGRLLYATDTGPLPAGTLDAVTGRQYDLVLLEESYGDAAPPLAAERADHLDLAGFAATVAQLRARGAITPATDVVAVHLGHENPPSPELDHRLAAAGARAVPDGTRLRAGGPLRPGRRTLVLGGARSGKSVHAESLLADQDRVTCVATGGDRPDDIEWAARVAAHRLRRPAHWRTVETTDVVPLLEAAGPADALLVDCLALWLTAVLDEAGAWEGGDGAGADTRVGDRCDALVSAWASTWATVVAVSNEVGSGVVPATASGRRFRDELGRLNTRLAADADEVTLVVAGLPVAVRTSASQSGAPRR